MTKLIILRGPSGSGKSSVAKELRKKSKYKTALVEQDYLRRIVLKEEDTQDGINSRLILQVVKFALDSEYNVILEGILFTKHYKEMLSELLDYHPNENYAYYFDVSFKETLKRHATKDTAQEFGEKEMKNWYQQSDTLGLIYEQVLPETLSLKQTVLKILKETKL